MISKEKFVVYINRLKNYDDYLEDIKEINRKYSFDSNCIDNKCYSITLDLLKDVFNDNNNSWIEYFIFELDYGSEYKYGTITIDTKNVNLSTPGHLYDLLIDIMKYQDIKED